MTLRIAGYKNFNGIIVDKLGCRACDRFLSSVFLNTYRQVSDLWSLMTFVAE